MAQKKANAVSEVLDESYPSSDYHEDVVAADAAARNERTVRSATSPVRKRLRMSVSEILADCKLEPIGAIVALIHDPDTPVNIKADLLKHMSGFLHSKKSPPKEVKENNPGLKLNLNMGRK